MEEIIDALNQAAQPPQFDESRPDEDTLVEIEEEILLPIPPEFKAFLLTAGHLVFGTLEPVSVNDPQAHTYLPEVTAAAWDAGLPRDLLPLCQIDDGYYCVDQQGEVALWQHQQLGDEQWQDVWEWAQAVWLNS